MGDNIGTCGGITSVLWRDTFSTVGEYLQYCGGILSVLWRLFSQQGDNISTVGIPSVYAGHNISTVGDNISTVEGIQYSGRRFLISACLAIKEAEK